MRSPVVPTLMVLSAAMMGPALAQSPTADQIIQQLRPTGSGGATRGIRPIGPTGEAPAPPRPGAPPVHRPGTPQAAAPAAPSVDLTVQFRTGSAGLTPQAAHTLDELGRALSSNTLAGSRFRIEGHTDTVGTPEANKALSEQRAAAVVEYLATKWHVDRAKVEPVGMGESQPLVPTGPNVPESRNRRVTVVNLGA